MELWQNQLLLAQLAHNLQAQNSSVATALELALRCQACRVELSSTTGNTPAHHYELAYTETSFLQHGLQACSTSSAPVCTQGSSGQTVLLVPLLHPNDTNSPLLSWQLLEHINSVAQQAAINSRAESTTSGRRPSQHPQQSRCTTSESGSSSCSADSQHSTHVPLRAVLDVWDRMAANSTVRGQLCVHYDNICTMPTHEIDRVFLNALLLATAATPHINATPQQPQLALPQQQQQPIPPQSPPQWEAFLQRGHTGPLAGQPIETAALQTQAIYPSSLQFLPFLTEQNSIDTLLRKLGKKRRAPVPGPLKRARRTTQDLVSHGKGVGVILQRRRIVCTLRRQRQDSAALLRQYRGQYRVLRKYLGRCGVQKHRKSEGSQQDRLSGAENTAMKEQLVEQHVVSMMGAEGMPSSKASRKSVVSAEHPSRCSAVEPAYSKGDAASVDTQGPWEGPLKGPLYAQDPAFLMYTGAGLESQFMLYACQPSFVNTVRRVVLHIMHVIIAWNLLTTYTFIAQPVDFTLPAILALLCDLSLLGVEHVPIRTVSGALWREQIVSVLHLLLTLVFIPLHLRSVLARGNVMRTVTDPVVLVWLVKLMVNGGLLHGLRYAHCRVWAPLTWLVSVAIVLPSLTKSLLRTHQQFPTPLPHTLEGSTTCDATLQFDACMAGISAAKAGHSLLHDTWPEVMVLGGLYTAAMQWLSVSVLKMVESHQRKQFEAITH